MNSISLICCLVAALSLMSSVASDNSCKTHTPGPLDETWYLEKMPTDGWYVTMQGELTEKQLAESTGNSKKMTGGGDKSICFSANFGKDGVAAAAPLVYRCMYKNVNEQLCSSSSPTGIDNPFLKTFGSVLKEVRLTFVLSDGQTYALLYGCASGSTESWLVFSTTENGPAEEEKVKIRALVKTTKEQEEKSKGKGYSGSRFKMDKSCAGAAPPLPVDGAPALPDTPDLGGIGK